MISVCMATYNGENYIKEQLDSIVCQLSKDDEIIISDDNSTDKTIDIIKSYNDNRIKIFYHEQEKRLLSMYAASFLLTTKNFENAINNAIGDFIYLSDQDDIWLPERIKIVQPLLEQYDLVMCNFKTIDENGNIINNKFYDKIPVSKYFLVNMKKTPFLGCCMSFKRSVLNYCLPFPKGCIGHDFWIGCLAVNMGKTLFLEKPLHLYRRHLQNVSPLTKKSKNTLWFKIFYRLDFAYRFFSRLIEYKLNRK